MRLHPTVRRAVRSHIGKSSVGTFCFIAMAVAAFWASSGAMLYALVPTFGSTATIERNFQRVLSAMRRPAATGLLIVSVRLPGAARRAGLRPGDILTWVEHHRIESPRQLDVILYHLRHSPLPFLSVAVARGERVIHVHVQRRALRINGLAVLAGVPAPLNPPPTPLALQWNRVPSDTAPRGLAENFWYRLFDHHIAVGMVHLRIFLAGTTGHLLWSVRAVAGCGVPTRRIQMVFTVGDNRRLPPFLLTSLTRQGFHRQREFIRRGTALLAAGRSAAKNTEKIPILFNVVPTPALAALAMAMPRRKGLVLAVPELGVGNLHTRPGCVMVVLGRRSVIFAGEKRRLWCVRVLRLDVPQITFWLDHFGHILRIDLPHHRQLFLAADAAAAQTGLSLPELPR